MAKLGISFHLFCQHSQGTFFCWTDFKFNCLRIFYTLSGRWDWQLCFFLGTLFVIPQAKKTDTGTLLILLQTEKTLIIMGHEPPFQLLEHLDMLPPSKEERYWWSSDISSHQAWRKTLECSPEQRRKTLTKSLCLSELLNSPQSKEAMHCRAVSVSKNPLQQ